MKFSLELLWNDVVGITVFISAGSIISNTGSSLTTTVDVDDRISFEFIHFLINKYTNVKSLIHWRHILSWLLFIDVFNCKKNQFCYKENIYL